MNRSRAQPGAAARRDGLRDFAEVIVELMITAGQKVKLRMSNGAKIKVSVVWRHRLIVQPVEQVVGGEWRFRPGSKPFRDTGQAWSPGRQGHELCGFDLIGHVGRLHTFRSTALTGTDGYSTLSTSIEGGLMYGAGVWTINAA